MRPIYSGIVASELAAIRLRDRLNRPRELDELNDLTAIVKTFERPKMLHRLITGLRLHYPDLTVIVADDSNRPQPVAGVTTVQLPFRSGVSVGRNAALEQVETGYVLNLDDDFFITSRSGISSALAAMKRNPEIDLMGGRVVDLPLFRTADYSRPALHKKVERPRGEIGGFPIYNIVPNYFLARTQRLRLVRWDPEIRVLDHTDFFSRAHGVLTTVFNDKMFCYHANTPFDRHYMRFREDLDEDHVVLRKRWKTR